MSDDLGATTVDVGGSEPVANAGDVGTPEQPVKRGRGRPKRDASEPARVNPADLGGTASGAGGGGDSGTDRTRSASARTRSSARASQKAVPLDINSLAVILVAAQLTAVKATNIPECMLAPEQNQALAQAIANVARHYPLVVSQKMQDITALVTVTGTIALTQAAAYRARIASGGTPNLHAVN